jgi:hypothetical protein
MATNTSFKIQCPSCEAMVPIRDPNLVGKKIDCPKCKYRFVVEEPDGDDGQPARGKARPAAKKKGGNNVLILGSVLGGIAIVVAGVVGYLLMAGGDSTPPKKTGPVANATPVPTPPPVSTATPTVTPTNDATAAPADVAPAVPPAPTAPTNPAVATLDPGHQEPVPEISNILPPDSQSVISINMDRLRNSTLGTQAFESPIGFRPDTFKVGFGLGVEEIASFIRAENFDQHWSFNVMKTHQPVTLGQFQARLGLKKGPKSPIQGRNYFVIAPNPLLDHLGTILQSELEPRQAAAAAKKKESPEPLTLVLLDETTVVVAQQDVMEEFLQSNAQPPKKAQVLDGAGGEAPPAGGQPPGRRQRGGGGAAPGAPGAGGPQFADRDSYLTIDARLKAMLDRFEQDRENVVVSMAQQIQSNPTVLNLVQSVTGFRAMRTFGVGLHQLNREGCKGQAGLEFSAEQDAKDSEDGLKRLVANVGPILGLYLGNIHIDVDGAPAAPAPGGAGPRPGRGGMQPGFGPPSSPGGAGAAGGPGGGDGPKSSIKVERKVRTLLLNVILNLNEPGYDRIYALTQGMVMRMKGMVDMSSGLPRFYELAAAVTKYRTEAVDLKGKEVKAANTFPRGTFARDDSQGRLSRSWPPDHRVSWMAGLLPFLGYQEIYDGIDFKQSWRSEVNLKQGTVFVPEFLNPRYERTYWRAHPPSLGILDVGATHFVGVAGVGIDAADYSKDDPAVAKKLGVFGYERRTTVKDITDGMSNTVYMIQVPPTFERAWIAGGGATITGIPETKSMEPFARTQGNGKRGTYVLMCDGSVRFVGADIPDDVFKALCTIKGGEEIADLNKVAPKVDPPKATSLKTEAAKADEP